MTDASRPFIVSWNTTKRCNLACGHCYLDSSELTGADAVSTVEANSFLDEIAELAPGCMLVLTGGEPLLRHDIFDISSRAASLGLSPVLGTNGTLLTDEIVKRLTEAGIQGAGVSVDSLSPALHDRVRGMEGAWTKACGGIEALSASPIPFQLQFTVMKENKEEVASFIDFAYSHGAKAVNFFFLVCTGRGQRSTDLSPVEYESVLRLIVQKEEEYKGRIMVRARCAPHIVRIAGSVNNSSSLIKGGTSGCIAGDGYLRISPEGFVTPCPYIPARADSPNLKSSSLKGIWDEDRDFVSLRAPRHKGRCGECEYAQGCGGCRARALATTGDLMNEDPWCAHEPVGNIIKEKSSAPAWSVEAEERLKKAPAFIRPMIKKGLERYAAAKGIRVITPELMAELREKTGR
ncbi:MAG TPA: hypothetical protein DDW94_05560 [Deltaproteobacteria bacterium]|nr:MAG: hypothetical protein A2Z79_04385 [Deltaproteobacteria bacterium GWA2_55_82]OGQ64162.1 MAG: hypothetical protein A3I81_10770 [Deltaproteobacteria bacterium RIFCSPLOWO2_02_FULL_55_12]OIJ74615.1 MAG: hypothetical protein A2V21_310295 [Deltaproteobacteria bacterium GWC2_55_46]HBG46441.1 hypothetical protein [Deltaproteobacteria bacterium]HCY10653.1 hypothetical protein [Deltaproteobacteria bacterium]